MVTPDGCQQAVVTGGSDRRPAWLLLVRREETRHERDAEQD